MSNTLHRRLGPWLAPLVIILVWQGLTQSGIVSSRTLPKPTDVIAAFWTLAKSGELGHHIWISSGRAMTGFAIGASIGLLLGLLTGLSRGAATLLDGTLQMIRNVPHLAIIPLVILWFGIGEEGKIFLVALGVFFPIYLNTYHGIRTVDVGLIEMGRIYGLSRAAQLTQIVLPSALPSILVGLRYALGIMWLTLIVAETIANQAGIGYMTMNAREFLQTDIVVLGIVIYAMLGKISDSAAKFLEHWFLSWHPAYTRS